LLHEQGYRTGHFGKWHMGPEVKPGTYGLETIGDESGAAGRRHQDPRGRDAQIFDQAIEFITQNKDRPFYVNVWGHISHFPVDPPPAFVERFSQLTVRERDFAMAMREKFDLVRRGGGDVNVCMRNYLADVRSLDESIGRLLRKIDELGLRDKTIVVFSSDQGAAPVRLPGEAGGKKAAKKAKRAAGEKAELRLNMLGNAGELRGGKHNMYEGGVRVPFIIRWPGHVPAGRVDEQSVISGIDWLPTLCRLTGIKLPSNNFDGEDVSDMWLGRPRERTNPLFWKTSNVRSDVAMLDGHWKIIVPGAPRGDIELFDLSRDPSETRNLAAERPELVQSLKTKVQAWNATLPTDYIKSAASDDAN
jgi:N-acetylgalactosamine-6-sulfatase